MMKYNKSLFVLALALSQSVITDSLLRAQIPDVSNPFFNGDVRSDLLGIDPQRARFVVWISSGNRFEGGMQWRDDETSALAQNAFFVGDVDGDHQTDIITHQRNPNQISVWRAGSNVFHDREVWLNENLNYSSYNFFASDVDSDGLSDMVGVNPLINRVGVWKSKGNGFIGGEEWLNENLSYDGYVYLMGDITGEGRSDIVAIRPRQFRAVTWLSSGSRFAGGSEWRLEALDYTGYNFFLSDVDGDRKDDIVAVYPNSSRVVVFRSQGDRFDGGVEWLLDGLSYSGHDFQVADVSGDGMSDIVAISPVSNRSVVWRSLGDKFLKWGEEWLNEGLNYSGYKFYASRPYRSVSKVSPTLINKSSDDAFISLKQGSDYHYDLPENMGNDITIHIVDVLGRSYGEKLSIHDGSPSRCLLRLSVLPIGAYFIKISSSDYVKRLSILIRP